MGWPATWIEIKPSINKPTSFKYEPFSATTNLFLIALNQIAIILTFQIWLPRFSTRSILTGTAFIAGLVLLGQTIHSIDKDLLLYRYSLLLYFSPTVAFLFLAIYTSIVRTKKTSNEKRMSQTKT